MKIRDGTVKHSSGIDWSDDPFKRNKKDDPGYYVFFGMWKGPFTTPEAAKSAYREWAWEAKHG